MAELYATDPLLALVDAPVAICDARGVLVRQNDAFAAWTGAKPGDRVDVHGGRGLIALPDAPARALSMLPLAGGGWLALPMGGEATGAAVGVSRAVSRRMERVERTLESNAAMALLESPSETVASCLRDMLAAAQELKALRAHVESLAGDAPAVLGPTCMRVLLRDVVGTLPEGGRVAVDESGADWTVSADRARLFSHVVALIGTLSQGGRIRVGLRGGDPVRLHVTPADDVPLSVAAAEAALESARRYVAVHGGRVLLDVDQLVVELPAWGRGAVVSGPAGLGTVLVADDDESTLAMMGTVLRRAGFRVLTADNGVAASALLRAHADELSAVVVDAVLPGCSGVELACEAQRYSPVIPVLLVSGHSSDIVGAGPEVPLLSKPFGARVLADWVKKLVDATGT
jgi:CheY-like chemotaxis protein